MTTYRLREAAELLGVSDDTLRRWADAGRLRTHRDAADRLAVDGAELARLATELGDETDPDQSVARSARNQLPGIVTRVQKDTVMAQVDLQCGRHRVVSLMSREAADALGLEAGVRATAVVKATTVVVEVEGQAG